MTNILSRLYRACTRTTGYKEWKYIDSKSISKLPTMIKQHNALYFSLSNGLRLTITPTILYADQYKVSVHGDFTQQYTSSIGAIGYFPASYAVKSAQGEDFEKKVIEPLIQKLDTKTKASLYADSMFELSPLDKNDLLQIVQAAYSYVPSPKQKSNTPTFP